LLTHGTGHMAFANAKAMALAGMTRQSPEISGGEILRDARGEPTGVLRESASRPIHQAHARALAGRTAEERRAALMAEARLAAAECLEYGITTCQAAGA